MAIPKVIHYCWFGGKELPDQVKVCIESWRKYCPDYEIVRWDESNYDYGRYAFAKEAYDAQKWAFVSDVARLDIVYQNGGIYLDTDVELIASLDPFLENMAFMGFEQGRKVATGLGFGAEKENSVIKANLDAYKSISFAENQGNVDEIACPIITTSVLMQIGLERKDMFQKLEGITVYPTSVFCPMLYSDGTADVKEDTVSIHRYAASWATKEVKEKARKRVVIYTRYGKYGLSIYDGAVLLREKGVGSFLKRLFEKITKHN